MLSNEIVPGDFFISMMRAQYQLQTGSMDNDPFELADMWITNHKQELLVRSGANYFAWWNAYACERELGEAMDEIAWKPWAKSDHFNAVRFVEEMVDAWHFFMNMLLVAIPLVERELQVDVFEETVEERIAGFCQWFTKKYYEKHEKNTQRQRDGYDGVSTKCVWCHRDFEEVENSQQWMEHSVCSNACYVEVVRERNAMKIAELDQEKQARRGVK